MANLTKQQEYLLSRIPKSWDLPAKEDDPEPSNVVSARKLIAAFEDKQSKKRVAFKARQTKSINAAREAIYFKPAEEALKIIKAMEAEYQDSKGN